jgi:hypothetical protein
VDHAWLRAPLRTTVAAFRTTAALQIGMNDLAEDGPQGGSIASFVFAHRSYQLFRDGALLAEGTDPLGAHAVPPGAATFRLTRTVELSPDVFPLSTQVDSAWTFSSAPPGPRQPSVTAPLLDVAVHLPVDDQNRVTATGPLAIAVEVTDPTTAAPRITSVHLELSTDDGRTWHEVTLQRDGAGSYRGVAESGLLTAGSALSLRTTARDAAGDSTEQTILRAALVG